MIISIQGNCDTRPVEYSLLKLFNIYGDTLYFTVDKKRLTMSDTKEPGGYYDNSCIQIFDTTRPFNPEEYLDSYEYIIFGGITIQPVDLVIYCMSSPPTKEEKERYKADMTENKIAIELYSDKTKLCDQNTAINVKSFESGDHMIPISGPLTQQLANDLSEVLRTKAAYIYETIMEKPLQKKSLIPLRLPKFKKRK